jgi:4-hydroxybenzoate polyprenyltransferase
MNPEISPADAPMETDPSAMPTDAEVVPLFVDLDGTVIATDVFCESLVAALKLRLRLLLQVPQWAARGRPALKRALSEHITPDPHTLPYHTDVLEFLAAEQKKGRPIILATATAGRWAGQLADHLGLFSDVLSSDAHRNLKGPQKLLAIQDYCRAHGYRTFAYMGDAHVDLHIWREAAEIYVVKPSHAMLQRIRALREPAAIFGQRPARWRAVLRVMRPHQWVKNVLLFAPLVLAHHLTDVPRLIASLWAFVAFCACASSVYVLNDLLDIEADRHHPRKQRRPFAAGTLPVMWGPPLVAGLLAGGLVLSAVALPPAFSLVLVIYLVSTILYSFWLKRRVLIDVFVLAGLYTLRIMAGGAATDLPISEWFMALSLFLFTSLAFAKRYTELTGLKSEEDGLARGRGYRLEDMRFIESIGPTCGYLAVLVLALYINSEGVKVYYAHPRLLWPVCPLMLYWISRLWLFATRRSLHEDPVIFAVTDRVSLATGALVALSALAASMPW